MKLHTVGTGSSGNAYALIAENEILLLDLGIESKKILKAIGYEVDKVVGAIVTHKHLDHSRSVSDFERMGIPIYKAYERDAGRKNFGGFSVQPFEVPHDGEPCVGYYIKHGNHKILYATDFEYLPVSFAKVGLTTMLIEANYQSKFVDGSLGIKTAHVLKGHAELQTTVKAIEHNATDSLSNIILCHLSKDNANEQEVIDEVRKVARNANVSVARKGGTTNLNEGV